MNVDVTINWLYHWSHYLTCLAAPATVRGGYEYSGSLDSHTGHGLLLHSTGCCSGMAIPTQSEIDPNATRGWAAALRSGTSAPGVCNEIANRIRRAEREIRRQNGGDGKERAQLSITKFIGRVYTWFVLPGDLLLLVQWRRKEIQQLLDTLTIK